MLAAQVMRARETLRLSNEMMLSDNGQGSAPDSPMVHIGYSPEVKNAWHGMRESPAISLGGITPVASGNSRGENLALQMEKGYHSKPPKQKQESKSRQHQATAQIWFSP